MEAPLSWIACACVGGLWVAASNPLVQALESIVAVSEEGRSQLPYPTMNTEILLDTVPPLVFPYCVHHRPEEEIQTQDHPR